MGYSGRENNFKNLLAVCNVEAGRVDSELTALTMNLQHKSFCCSANFQNFGK